MTLIELLIILVIFFLLVAFFGAGYSPPPFQDKQHFVKTKIDDFVKTHWRFTDNLEELGLTKQGIDYLSRGSVNIRLQQCEGRSLNECIHIGLYDTDSSEFEITHTITINDYIGTKMNIN